VVICDRFSELLTEVSGGAITVQTFGPETIPPMQQLEPVQNGLFQVLCTYPGFHTGVATLLTGLESIRPDAEGLRASGAREVIDGVYADLGLQVLAVPLGHGYGAFLNRELSDNGDLTGMQIRALPPQHPYLAALNATPVVLPPAEMFSALERGVVDGAFFPLAGAALGGFAGVTNHFFNVPGTAPHIILANPAFWAGLSDETRAQFLEAAKIVEDETPALYARLNDEERVRLEESGVAPVSLSPEAEAALKAAVVSGSWAFAGTRNPEAAEQMQKLVKDAGLLSE
jgi:TRAP-type C4-dicarboxylate transport system substrate-binding protein